MRQTWAAAGFPKYTGENLNLGQAAAFITVTLNQIQEVAERDNKFVYFQPVPGSAHTLGSSSNSTSGEPLPPLPLEASVMNPAAFKEPSRPSPPVVFVYQPKPSMFSSLFSRALSSTTAAIVSATAPTPAAAGSDASSSASSADTSGGTSGASAPPAPPTSDESYAQTLQRQYDTENAAAASRQLPHQSTNDIGKGPPPPPQFNSLV